MGQKMTKTREISIFQARNRKERLKELKESKFLTNRVFIKICENMHYEVFKNLNSRDLLELRAVNIGGYQITSNSILRNRIKNYISNISPKYTFLKANIKLNIQRINFVFEQMGNEVLSFADNKLGKGEIGPFALVLKHIPQLKEIILCNCVDIYIYIYKYIYIAENNIGDKEMLSLTKSLKNIPDLRSIRLCMYSYFCLYRY